MRLLKDSESASVPSIYRVDWAVSQEPGAEAVLQLQCLVLLRDGSRPRPLHQRKNPLVVHELGEPLQRCQCPAQRQRKEEETRSRQARVRKRLKRQNVASKHLPRVIFRASTFYGRHGVLLQDSFRRFGSAVGFQIDEWQIWRE